jgi:two-component system cell cycle response regulator
VSLSLEDESAFSLFRQIRGDNRTKQTPVFALVGKADVQDQQQAQAAGFTAVVSRPVDFGDLESKMAKAMGRDISQRYYAVDGDVTVMRLPQNCTPAALADVASYLKGKFSEAVESGRRKLVIDLKAIKAVNAGVTKLLQQAMKISQELGMQSTVAGEPKVIADCRSVSGADGWLFFETLEAAKAGFGKSSAKAPQLARAS